MFTLATIILRISPKNINIYKNNRLSYIITDFEGGPSKSVYIIYSIHLNLLIFKMY